MPNNTVSRAMCIRALLRAGFRHVESSGGFSILERAGRSVLIPEFAQLEPEIVDVVLAAARVTREEFETLLWAEMLSCA